MSYGNYGKFGIRNFDIIGQWSLNLELNQAYIEWILGHILIFEGKPLWHVCFCEIQS